MAQRQRRRTTRALVAGAIGLAVAATVVTTQFANAATTTAASQTVDETIEVTGTFDGQGGTFVAGSGLGDGSQDEHQKPVFELADGATITDLTIGVPGADGIHCLGSCTIKNVNWQDVGEDAATFLGTGSTVLVDGGSAAKADDKVFQDNRLAGGSVTIRDFTVSDFGKLYRSCGNCKQQAARTATLENITAIAPGSTLAGVNANLGDRLTIKGATIGEDIDVCDIFDGNDTGAEPTKLATEPDGKTCVATGVTTG